MEQISVPPMLQKSMEFHFSYCELHTYRKNGQDIIKPVQKMVINGKVICPRCEVEKETLKLKEQEQARYEEVQKKKIYNILYNSSVLEDNTILNASFETFFATCDEEIANKAVALEVVERLKDGQVFNTIFQGNAGTGKSHLAFSILKELNESHIGSCLYINVGAMLRKIKDSFNNKNSKFTESYFVELLSKVKFLALDDIGAETGAIDTDKTATDFVQRVLYAITTTRQDKATIITTNLASKTLFNMYDSKLVSRLFKRPKYIIFKYSKDKRMSEIPF